MTDTAPVDETFLRDFFRALASRPLEPDEEPDLYVPFYASEKPADDDPVAVLARGVEWASGSGVQLLSGYRGSGKSTELRRLRGRLKEAGYLVVLCDIERYVNLSVRIDVSDFLMALAGALGEAVAAPEFLGRDPSHQGYWERLSGFLTKTEVSFEELKLKPGVPGLPGEIKLALKSDPTFKQILQKTMAGHLGALVEDVHEYVRDVMHRLRKKHGEETEVVLLIDSLEHLRGTSDNAEEVHRSVEILFGGHADKLHLPELHVVYTVPPFLKVRHSNLGSLYRPGGLQVLPAVKLRDKETGQAHKPGVDKLVKVIGTRGDWQRLLGRRELLEELIHSSGGHLRDLLRLVAEVVRRADVAALPVDAETVRTAISRVRNEFLPIANEDAVWLQRVAETHRAEFPGSDSVPDLARFLDTHMILCYHNGQEWYDVHPLIAAEVLSQARTVQERRERESQPASG